MKTEMPGRFTVRWPLLLIAVLGSLLAACTLSPTPTPALPSGLLGKLPAALAGLPRAETSHGETVIRESRRFFGVDSALLEGVVAHYRDDEGLATLWVVRVKTEEAAVALVDSFVGAVQAGGTLYTLAETRASGGVTVNVLDGQGREQYLFAAGDRVVLLDVFPRWGEEALRDLLSALP